MIRKIQQTTHKCIKIFAPLVGRCEDDAAIFVINIGSVGNGIDVFPSELAQGVCMK